MQIVRTDLIGSRFVPVLETTPPSKLNFIDSINNFYLSKEIKELLNQKIPPFGYDGFGEFIFYRTYSRIKENGQLESWTDCVIRVIEGVMTIRKNWYKQNNIYWNEKYWNLFAEDMTKSMYDMKWLPPGRGLWCMGTDYMREIGSISLFNCGFSTLNDIPNDINWIMDSLMNGVGVGFEITKTNVKLYEPNPNQFKKIIIGDSREEWCEATTELLKSYFNSYQPTVIFDYSKIRPAGLPIKRFGGVSSGSSSLRILHERIREFCKRFICETDYSETMFKADLANSIGCCVVSGNVRRSAMLAAGDIDDSDFLSLKEYENPRFSYRKEFGWMSNNSVRLSRHEDFERLGDIANKIIVRGEPGYINMINVKKFGRVGKDDGLREDNAVGTNPCSEIPLFDKCLCNLSETIPTNCVSIEEWYKSLEFATFYCSTVNLLPTHRQETNKILFKNRRIGVGIMDFSGWKHELGICKITRYLREGYKIVRNINKILADEAGIPESIRTTCVKPGGTVPKLAGKTSGVGHPNFHYMIRRVRVQENSPMQEFLLGCGVPSEKDSYSQNTVVFEFPVRQGPAKPAEEVSIWEQAMNVVLMQREWSDNAVSNTICFDPKTEIKEIEPVLSSIAPLTKSISMLPRTPKGVYKQMPEEQISIEEYEKRKKDIKRFDWNNLRNSVAVGEKFCDGDKCEIKLGS